ncbi:SUZ RNA-binding domain-containing-like [Babylonia areolata]|uniref:SUZ RNA-binding domain-containing-like n=1 Tax=Babylonia areolata TaxID=304850 RepID=UPI003FCFE977
MAEDSGDVLDSWEDQVDSGVLDERLKKMSVSSSATQERPQPVVMQEDTGRTEYKPQVRILKREPNSNSHSMPGNTPRVVKTKKPMKTLEQREAEYAEARMRIFGSAEASEPESDANSSGGPVTAVNCTVSDRQYKVNKAEAKTDNSIIRQPLGPDGSKGFHSNR